MTLYNPWRVKAPMKRTNPTKSLTADPKWVEITWDEALNTIADRLKKVKADDPRKAVFIDGFGTRSNREKSAFISAFGSPNTIRVGGAACAYHFGCAYVHGQHPEAIVDMDRVEWIMNIGRNMGPTTVQRPAAPRSCWTPSIAAARSSMSTPTAAPSTSKSTEWVPIKPATDLRFHAAACSTRPSTRSRSWTTGR